MSVEVGIVGGDAVPMEVAVNPPKGEAWKSSEEMVGLVRSAKDLLSRKEPPISGWTSYKFNKKLIKKVRENAAQKGLPIRSKEDYLETWDWIKRLFNTQALDLGPDVLTAMKEVQATINTVPTTYDVLGEEKTRVWNCVKWIFPLHLTEKVHDLPDVALPTPDLAAPDAQSKPMFKDRAGFYGAPLIIANCPLPSQMEHLWELSGTRCCADGGGNRLFDWAKAEHPERPESYYVPDFIVGDLDSLRAELKEHFHRLGSKLNVVSDQDSTDLDKTLSHLIRSAVQPVTHIIITGALGGNVSQEMANFHSCWGFPNQQIAIVGDNSLVLFLAPGQHVIHCAPNVKCGILPIGEPCKSITTSGLKWNLDNSDMRFGGLISSSNVTVESVVKIDCSHPVLWTFDVAPEKF